MNAYVHNVKGTHSVLFTLWLNLLVGEVLKVETYIDVLLIKS